MRITSIESASTIKLADATRIVSVIFFVDGVRHVATLQWHPDQIAQATPTHKAPLFAAVTVMAGEADEDWPEGETPDESAVEGFAIKVDCTDDLEHAQWRVETRVLREIAYRLNPNTPELVNMVSKYAMLNELGLLDGGQMKPLRGAIERSIRQAGLSYDRLTLAALGSRMHLPGQYAIEAMRHNERLAG